MTNNLPSYLPYQTFRASIFFAWLFTIFFHLLRELFSFIFPLVFSLLTSLASTSFRNPIIQQQRIIIIIMEDSIHQLSFQLINTLNGSLSQYHAQNPILGDLSLQVILHIISCVAALRDIMESQKPHNNNNNNNMNNNNNSNNNNYNDVQTHFYLPFINGTLGTLGKLIMEGFTFEPKANEILQYSTCYALLLRHTLRLFPEMINKRHRNSGKVLLHHVAFKSRPAIATETIRLIISVSPSSVQITDSSGALPLHWATRNEDLPVECIDILVNAYPQSVGMADNKGFLPLHWAVNADQPNVDIIRKLLKLNPQSASTPTSSGSLPLHYAVSRSRPSPGVIKALMAAFPDAIRYRCEEGFLPLHRYLQNPELDVEILKQLILFFPDGLTSVNGQKQTPLHVALDQNEVQDEVIALLLSYSTTACSLPDQDGYYPLHLLLDHISPNYYLAEDMIQHYPLAASMPTNDGMLPLHLILSLHSEPPISFLATLLRANPAALETDVRDVVPAIGGEILADPESWSGEWVERSWKPIERARERGLNETANFLEELRKDPSLLKEGGKYASLSYHSANPLPVKEVKRPASALLAKTNSQAQLKLQEEDLRQYSVASPPRTSDSPPRFSLAGPVPGQLGYSAMPAMPAPMQPNSQPMRFSPSSPSYGPPGTPYGQSPFAMSAPLPMQMQGMQMPMMMSMTMNNPYGMPASTPSFPGAREMSPSYPGPREMTYPVNGREMTPSNGAREVTEVMPFDNQAPMQMQPRYSDMDMRPSTSEPQLLVGNFMSPAPTSTAEHPARALPSGPIPPTLLQAAEHSAMRLSRAQYDFLRAGKKTTKKKKAALAAVNNNPPDNNTNNDSAPALLDLDHDNGGNNNNRQDQSPSPVRAATAQVEESSNSSLRGAILQPPATADGTMGLKDELSSIVSSTKVKKPSPNPQNFIKRGTKLLSGGSSTGGSVKSVNSVGSEGNLVTNRTTNTNIAVISPLDNNTSSSNSVKLSSTALGTGNNNNSNNISSSGNSLGGNSRSSTTNHTAEIMKTLGGKARIHPAPLAVSSERQEVVDAV